MDTPLCACGCGERTELAGSRYRQGHSARHQYPSLAQVFRERVDRTETCWIWQGAVDASGYGRLRVRGRRIGVHVLAWEMANRRRVAKGQVVCHRCDQKRCVRPDHLFVGSQADNVADRDAKDHTAKGMRNAAAKLSDDEVRDIRRRSAEKRERLAREFRVSVSTIKQIRAGLIWKHIEVGAP